MYLTTHAAVGVLISQQTSNPWVAFFGAIVSHFVLDFVPHGDENVENWAKVRARRIALIAVLDLGGIGLLLLALVQKVTLPTFNLVVLGVVGAILPDVLALVAPAIRELRPQNVFVRAIDWFQKHFFLAPLFRSHRALHEWIHNPWHDLLPVKLSEQIGLMVQLFILTIFFAAELAILGR